MLFNSFIFFIFLGFVLPVFYLLPKKSSRNVFLLVASYFFYGYWDWRFCGLLLFSTLADYFIGARLYNTVNPHRRKLLLILSLSVNLGVLGFFKYFNFFIGSFERIIHIFNSNLDFLHLNIILPVGISFYTFQSLSYTIDIYRKKLKPIHNLVDFALFVSFFPQLVAGPIERASNLLPQLSKKNNPTKQQISEGIVLIITGLFRKVMIGDTAGRYVDHIFANPDIYTSGELLFALFLFAIQIYADFSGYSHIARGTAKLFGIEVMKNFEQPYFSRNITEFWRRWHISLSSWLKDYLYISLGGNRKGVKRTYINVMLTMLLGGLWHGASWNFVIWGGLHGLFLCIHKYFLRGKKIIRQNFKYKNLSGFLKFSIQVIATNVLVIFSWVFFRSVKWENTGTFFSKMLHWESSPFSLLMFSIAAGYLLMIALMDTLEYRTNNHTYLLQIKTGSIRYGILTSLFVVTLLFMFQSKPLPFVYFQF